MSIDDGEIPLLDAERIDDIGDLSAPTSARTLDADEKAIVSIATRLRKTPAGALLGEDALEERSIDLYNRFCALIRSGKASPEQISKAAELCGEEESSFVERISADRQPDDLSGSPAPSGSLGLLRALRS